MTGDYAAAVAAFSLERLEAGLHGTLRSLNACTECCDRHPASALALRWSNAAGGAGNLTFGELRDRASRFANLLAANGVQPGDVVAGLLPRTSDLLAAALGTWRAGAIYQPLFTAFGPKAIAQRLGTSRARVVVTDAANRPKLDGLPSLGAILLTGPGLDAELARQPARFDPAPRTGDDPFLLMSTSGTTGMPKGVLVPLRALLGFGAYMRQSLDLRPDDRFWNLADPGWAYGMYYAVAGPLLLGQAATFHDGPFTAAGTLDALRRHGVTNLAGAPTAFRALIADGGLAGLRGQLRVISSAGEPLNPEVMRWVREHLGIAIMDHYGQTELGMVVCNHHGLRHAVLPGSAGLPLPGYRIAVLDAAGAELPPGVPGTLSVDIGASPLMWFPGYLGQKPLPAAGYYRTGDTVEGEPGGGISFIGRSDDIITSAGYRIGPFEVESALVEHPAVMEAAVVGRPDPARTEVAVAYVVLSPGTEASPALAAVLQRHVRTRLSAHAYPREVRFVAELPKTPSGKLQRFVLRAQESLAASVPPAGPASGMA